jgi:hypothetical protein
MSITRRRATLSLAVPLLGGAAAGVLPAGCAAPEPPSPPPGPISFSYLLPLPLDVAALAISEEDPPPVPGDIGATLSPRPAEAVRIMARDRLSAVGSAGRAVFAVTRASLARGGGGLACALACRLEVVGPEESGRRGFAEAEARAAVTGAEAARPFAADRLLRRTMEGLNVEFEFQLRRTLREWLVATAPGESRGSLTAPPPAEVTREDLPRS